MKKKLIAVLLTAAMAVGCLAGCGNSKTTSGGAIFAAIAAVKNSSAVINSGSREVAHSRIVMPTISEGRNRGWVNQSDIPVSCRFFPQVYDALRDR